VISALSAELRTTVGVTVILYFTVTNVSDEPVELEFEGGQQYDFAIVERRTQRQVWHWGANRLFGGVPRSHLLAPGERITFLEPWPRAARGDYTASAWLTSSSHKAAAAVNVDLTEAPGAWLKRRTGRP
jgi:intracellular proteinase inhibitor BsuPI